MNPVRLRAALRPYGLKIGRLQACASLYKRNAAYRAVSGRGEMLIKPFYFRRMAGYDSAVRQISRAAACIGLMRRRGYRHMPVWRTTRSGRHWIMVKGKPYYMTEWVTGRPISMTEPDMEALGKALAELHVIRKSASGHGRKISCSEKLIHELRQGRRLFLRQLPQLRARITLAGKWFAAHGKEAAALSDRAIEMLKSPAIAGVLAADSRRAGLIHGDVTIPNIIVAQDGLKLIDWDTVGVGPSYGELAQTLANVTGFNTAMMAALLRGYEDVRPLGQEDRRLVCALFHFPREAWIAAKHERTGRQNGMFSILESTWADRLKAVEWIGQWSDAPK